jgi:hypothetical protein
MRDLAALTPPLVMAVAFIAGVIALLRKEMAPRRRGEMGPPDELDLPRSEMTLSADSQMMRGARIGDVEDDCSDNSSNQDVSTSSRREPPRGDDDPTMDSTS